MDKQVDPSYFSASSHLLLLFLVHRDLGDWASWRRIDDDDYDVWGNENIDTLGTACFNSKLMFSISGQRNQFTVH